VKFRHAHKVFPQPARRSAETDPGVIHGIVCHDDVWFISSPPWVLIRSKPETFLGGG